MTAGDGLGRSRRLLRRARRRCLLDGRGWLQRSDGEGEPTKVSPRRYDVSRTIHRSTDSLHPTRVRRQAHGLLIPRTDGEDLHDPRGLISVHPVRVGVVTKKKPRSEADDFAGMSRGGVAVMLAIVALGHPWQALRELFAAVRRLGRRMRRLALAPAGPVAAVLWSRHRDRRPTFEDYLHGRDADGGPPSLGRAVRRPPRSAAALIAVSVLPWPRNRPGCNHRRAEAAIMGTRGPVERRARRQ